MWVVLWIISVILLGGNCVILRDPKLLSCDDYDLFDPKRRILSDNSQPSTQADYEYLAQQAVHQLGLRSNASYKWMLLRLKEYKTMDNGKIWMTLQQMESRCRNDGKMIISLAQCPLKENGKIEQCNLTMNVSAVSNRRVRVENFYCRRVSMREAFDVDTMVSDSAMDIDKISGIGPIAGYSSPTMDNFRCFMIRHSKKYGNEERSLRFQQFQRNMKMAYFLQATEQGTGVYGPSRFSDLSSGEFKKYYTGLKPSRSGPGANRGKLSKALYHDLPDAFDWRNKSVVTPVKDQGQCGSCWAFSTTGNVEGQWAIKTGKLVSVSEQELVDCDKLDEGCGGGLPSNAYKEIIRLGGLETETDYPYDGKNDKCSFKKSAVKVYINDSITISTNETEMAQWLFQNGPISIGINANAMMLYIGGVSHPWKIVCSPKNLDHGVLIVGYGIDDKKNEPFWAIKNSWGPHWGVKGYYLVYRGDGTCGLNMMCTSAVVE